VPVVVAAAQNSLGWDVFDEWKRRRRQENVMKSWKGEEGDALGMG